MTLKPGACLLCLAFLPGCEARNLYVAHDTVLGINAKVNQGRQTGQLVVGYDRDFATVIPTSVPVRTENGVDTGQRDAMSLVHCAEIRIDGINLGSYSDFTATGDAVPAFDELNALKYCGSELDPSIDAAKKEAG
jgi:hypothetical protein